jgi:hypothetical protein
MEDSMEQKIEQNQLQYHIVNCYLSTTHETAQSVVSTIEQYKNEQQLLIEVSFDQYDEVIEHIQLNTTALYATAQSCVKKGAFTYEQVKHIAEACCIHELHLEEDGRITLTSTVLSMSAMISFAQSKWNGADRQTAIKNAVYTGISIFGETFAEEVIMQQFEMRNNQLQYDVSAGLKGAIAKNGTKAVAKKMATKLTKKAMLSSAVAKKTIMLLNANVVTGALVTGVMSTVDVARAIKGQLSPQQLFKNVTKTAASVAGGIAGMLVFAGIGLKIPSVSTAVISLIGGVLGLILGSMIMTKITSKVLDLFIKDDAVKMLAIFNDVLLERAQSFILNEEELNEALKDFNTRYDMKTELRNMYAAPDRHVFAKDLIEHELARIVKQRMYLHVPKNEEVFEVLEHI